MGFIEKTRQFLRGISQQPQGTSPSFLTRAQRRGEKRFISLTRRQQPPRQEKKHTRSEFKGLLKGAWKGSRLSRQERTGLEKSLFPYQKYGSQISEKDVKNVLQKLRKEEFWSKDFKKKKELSRQRKTLEEATGFKGKY